MPWATANTSEGHRYRLFTQALGEDCGPACALMVLELKLRRRVEEEAMRIAFASADAGALAPAVGGPGGDQGPASSIVAVLGRYGVPARQVPRAEVARWIRQTSPTMPALLGVDWGVIGLGWGAHWILCTGVHAGRFVCLDPWHGLTRSPTSVFPYYFPGENAGRGRIEALIQIAW